MVAITAQLGGKSLLRHGIAIIFVFNAKVGIAHQAML